MHLIIIIIIFCVIIYIAQMHETVEQNVGEMLTEYLRVGIIIPGAGTVISTAGSCNSYCTKRVIGLLVL